jgi:hypothetical protein
MSKKQIWFFDDDNRNAPSIENSKIHFIKVNRTEHDGYHGYHGHHEPTSKYFTRKMNCGKFVPEHTPVPISGITEENIKVLKEAILKQKVEAVIFDWDKTLLTRSMWFPQLFIKNTLNVSGYKKDLAHNYSSLEGIENCSDKEVAHYFFHDPNDGERKTDVVKRPCAIADMLHHLQNMNIPVYVLTNNLGAMIGPGYDNRLVFTDMLNQIGVKIHVNNIIYNTLRNKENTIMKVILPKIRRHGNKTQRRKRKKHMIKRTRKCHHKQ